MRRFAIALLTLILLSFAPAAARAQTAVDPTATADPFHGPLPFATAQCHDGWFSFSPVQAGACDGHGGVMIWIVEPGTGCPLPPFQASQCSKTYPSACDLLASRVQQGTGHPDPRFPAGR